MDRRRRRFLKLLGVSGAGVAASSLGADRLLGRHPGIAAAQTDTGTPLRIRAAGADRVVYAIQVNGVITAVDTEQGRDAVLGATAVGDVGADADRYRFSGQIVDLRASGPVTVEVDGTSYAGEEVVTALQDRCGGETGADGDGAADPVSGPADIDASTTGVGQAPRPELQGTVVRTSEIDADNELKAAFNRVGSGDTVIVDSVVRLTERNNFPIVPSGIVVKGEDGGKIVSEARNFLWLNEASGTWIDGLEIDGQMNTDFGMRANGDHGLSHLTITNCLIHHVYRNAIAIAPDHIENDSIQNTCESIHIIGNELHNYDSHGVFLGPARVGSPDGSPTPMYSDMKLVRNHVHDGGGRDGKSGLALTFYGSASALTVDSVIAENFVERHGFSPIAFENGVRDSVIHTNRVEQADNLGIGVTGSARNNTVRDNILRDGLFGLICTDRFSHAGPGPTGNVFRGNTVERCRSGIDLREAANGNTFESNTFREVEDRWLGDASGQTIRDNTWS